MDNTWYTNLRRAKDYLEFKGHHMGTGEMFRLIMLAREEVPRYSQDEYLVKMNREVHDSIWFAMKEYERQYFEPK